MVGTTTGHLLQTWAGVRLETVDLHWPVTLVCWDNGFRSSLGRLGPGGAPNVERITQHAR
jgi:hypothetical protein